MTTPTKALPREDLARAAAEAAAVLLPAGGPLTIGDPMPAWDGPLPDGQAVSAKFTGGTQGCVTVVVGADLVELRLDSMEHPDAAAALEGRRKPVIATCRPLREGGMFDGPEEARRRVLDEAHRLGAEFIDVEASTLDAFCKRHGS